LHEEILFILLESDWHYFIVLDTNLFAEEIYSVCFNVVVEVLPVKNKLHQISVFETSKQHPDVKVRHTLLFFKGGEDNVN
jgi:hypothetical protein